MRSNSQQQPTSPHNQQPQPQQPQLPQPQQQGQQQQQVQPQQPGVHKQLPPPVQRGQAPLQPPPVPLQQQIAQQQVAHLFPRPGNAAAVPQLPLDAAGRLVPPLQVCDPAWQWLQMHCQRCVDFSAWQGTAACCMPWTRALLGTLLSIEDRNDVM